jgi:16S rRNA (guanine1207-N2)-methyltransferase
MEQTPVGQARRSRRLGLFSLDVNDRHFTFLTQPGVFSQDGLDEGTNCLITTVLPRVRAHQRVLDLGTGIGVIGIVLGALLTRGEVWMVDVDLRAVRLAEENVRRNGLSNAHVVLSDATLDLPPNLRFDMVVSNPPTHSGKDVLQVFVREAYGVLRPGGSAYFVVNRLLSLQDMMAAEFHTVEMASRCKGFIVFHSEKARLRSARDTQN